MTISKCYCGKEFKQNTQESKRYCSYYCCSRKWNLLRRKENLWKLTEEEQLIRKELLRMAKREDNSGVKNHTQ